MTNAVDLRDTLLSGVSAQCTWRYIYAYRVEYLVYTDWVEQDTDPKYQKFKTYRQQLRDWFGLNPSKATPQEFWTASNAAHPGELYQNPATDDEEYQRSFADALSLINKAEAGHPVTADEISEHSAKLSKYRFNSNVRASV